MALSTMEQGALKIMNNGLNIKIAFYLDTTSG
jgi:hypothetical protein